MNRDGLEKALNDEIPITRSMGVTVLSASMHQVRLVAPLALNANHLGTAFGGSLSTLATLAAWSVLTIRMTEGDHRARIVIQSNSMRYLAPATSDFEAASLPIDDVSWQRFLEVWTRRGLARIDIESEVTASGRIVGSFQGRFVAISPTT